jgi:hypothetical protein
MTESTEATADTGVAASGLRAGIVQKAIEPLLRAVRDEVRSVRKEIVERVASARTGVVLVLAGALLGLIALGLVATLAVVLLALALPLWGAAAIVLVVFAVGAGVLVAVGVRGIRRGVPPLPRDALARRRSTERAGAH